MDLDPIESRARAWMLRFSNQLGSGVFPPHLARRLAAAIDPATLLYLDVLVPPATGGRADINVIALVPGLVVLARCDQVLLGRTPEAGDATTTVTLHSLNELQSVSIGGHDMTWVRSSSDSGVEVPPNSVTITFSTGATVMLPHSWRADPNPQVAIDLLVSALTRRGLPRDDS